MLISNSFCGLFLYAVRILNLYYNNRTSIIPSENLLVNLQFFENFVWSLFLSTMISATFRNLCEVTFLSAIILAFFKKNFVFTFFFVGYDFGNFGKSARTSRRQACWPLRKLGIIYKRPKNISKGHRNF